MNSKWTTNPVKSGYYWFQRTPQDAPEPVSIIYLYTDHELNIPRHIVTFLGREELPYLDEVKVKYPAAKWKLMEEPLIGEAYE